MERELDDQASTLRRITKEKSRTAKYLSVSSGKGGVGKTTFVVNLALLLAEAGKKVLVFDADLGLANIDIMLKVPPGANIRRYIEGKSSIGDILIKGIYGFDLLPASSGVLELAELSDEQFEKIRLLLVALDSDYDYVIMDTGAGIAGNVHRFAGISDYMIVVSQPEPTAIADAYAFLKVMKQKYPVETAYLVFNRVDDALASHKVYDNFKGVVRRFLSIDLKLLASLEEASGAKRAMKFQKPISILEPGSPFVQGVRTIVKNADALWNKTQQKRF